MLTEAELRREAARSGFRPEALEKVLHLLELLDALRSHPFLGPRLALKGGTALNLFLFDVPRLSVDIDVNYVGGASRDAMLQERPRLERALRAVCERLGMGVRRAPSEHAGGKWRLWYTAGSGASGTLEIDVNPRRQPFRDGVAPRGQAGVVSAPDRGRRAQAWSFAGFRREGEHRSPLARSPQGFSRSRTLRYVEEKNPRATTRRASSCRPQQNDPRNSRQGTRRGFSAVVP